MGLFGDILKAGESLFKNEDALDPDFIPKNLPYRENQHHQIANAIKPLLMGRNGRNLFVCGAPGIGKTAAVKWVLKELEEETEDIIPIYINCWQRNTSYQIYAEILQQIGYSFSMNKRSEELLEVIKNMLNRKAAVFCFDEIDKATDYDFLYSLLGEIYRKSVILVTNFPDWLSKLEDRIRSRLLPELICFKEYSHEETAGIIRQRIGYAFVPGVWTAPAQAIIVDATHSKKDLRVGLFLMRESGLLAEESASKRIEITHTEKAVEKLAVSYKKPKEEKLSDELKPVLDIVKENSGDRIGELFEKYTKKGGDVSYKTFQRRIDKLSKSRLINTKKETTREGNTTIVSFEEKSAGGEKTEKTEDKAEEDSKLSDY